MPFFTLMYNNEREMRVEVDEPEVQSKRLKNHILKHFDNIKYDDIILYIVDNGKAFSVDDNEMVDDEMDFILEIDVD